MNELEDFESFMRNYQNMVFTHAYRLLGNQAEAADVSQTVFLKAFEKFAEIAHSPTVGGWLKTVTTNLCLNHLQRYRNRWRLFSELAPPDSDDAEPHLEPVAEPNETAAMGDDEKRLLEEALRRLPDAQRVPLVLHHFEDRSCEDIARELRVSVGKVKTDMHRGRIALRRKLMRNEAGELSALRTGA